MSRYVGVVTDLARGGIRELYARPEGQTASLDALRSFAILLVVFHHWAARDYAAAGGQQTPLQNLAIFWYGWAGVDLFFVLSGYLIGKQLWRELDRTGTINFGRFMLRRGLRIWPIYFATLAFYALTSSVVRPALSDWTFVSNYTQGGFDRGWSLSTEEQFYLSLPLLLLFIRRRIPLIRYVWVLLAIESVVLINRYFALAQLPVDPGAYSKAAFNVIYPFHQHLEGLLAGLAIALLTIVRPKYFIAPSSPRGVSWRGAAIFLGATIVAILVRGGTGHLFAFAGLGLVFGSATYFTLLDRSALTRWMHWRVWYPISRLSYSMYLNHWLLLPVANVFLVREVRRLSHHPNTVFLITMLLGTLISVALATIMFLVVEHPFLVLRDRVLTRRRANDALQLPQRAAPAVVSR